MRRAFDWLGWSAGMAAGAVLLLGCAAASAQPSGATTQGVGSSGAKNEPVISPRLAANPAEPERFDYFDGLRFSGDVPSPAEYLGYPIGDHFSRHGDIVGYMKTLAEVSDRVQIRRYGQSHQRRDLHIVTISSPDNLARLDKILASNAKLTDPRNTSAAEADRIINSNPAIAWFSFNVHGNEPSPAEASMQVAYTLAAGEDDEVRGILDDVVLVIDPIVNPDGRERYVSFYENTVGVGGPNPSADAAEHDEPWPGGRTNHYLFDLNRDWLWMVHPESRSRIGVYAQHRPQLHIDYHEQGYRSPYFFGAGDDPYNTNIPAETREWIELYGAHNAEVFDREGLVYATKERFDYLYPGYGKVLPVYHGAVGMLTEKAGHGFAGLAIKVSDQYTLTLRERARHHYLTAMSYLETTSENREEQLRRFHEYFRGSMRPEPGGDTAYVISAGNDPALLQRVWDICNPHGIEIHTLDGAAELAGLRDYRTGEAADGETVSAGSWIIPAGQPMGRLVRALFERTTEVTSKETYDITGWSLPISFGLDAWYATEPLGASMSRLEDWSAPEAKATGDGDVALLIDASQHLFPRAAGLIIEHDLFARRVNGAIRIDGDAYPAGSIIIHTIRNMRRDLDGFVQDCLDAGVNVHRVSGAMTETGHVLGANDNWLFTNPEIILLRDSPVSSYSFGQVWHLLDVETGIPHTTVNTEALRRVQLSDYNVLIVPEVWGNLSGALGEGVVDELKSWVRSGGTLVAIGSGAEWATDTFLDVDEGEADDTEADEEPKPSEMTWAERREEREIDGLPGPMMSADVDVTHPFAAGASAWTGVIKRNRDVVGVEDDGYVVARFDEDPFISGYISEENQRKFAGTPFMTHHAVGGGHVVCLSDDITIRGFMHGPMRLLLNAVIYGPSL